MNTREKGLETGPLRRAGYLMTVVVVSAALLLAACDTGADGDRSDVAAYDAEMVSRFDALAGRDGLPTQKTGVAIEELVAMGDSAVPALHAKLEELGNRIDEIKAGQELDSRGLPNYGNLDAETAQRQKAEWATVNKVHGHVIRILQRIDTPAAKRALRDYFDSRELAPDPVATVAKEGSSPAQLWTALELILWCGNYDATTRQLALERMASDQNRRVRALAAHLAARSGLGDDALPVLMDMVQSPKSGPDGRDLHVLLGLAYLKDAEKVSRIAATRPFRSDDVELARNVARFEHADADGRYALMRELKPSAGRRNPVLDIVFAGYILGEGRMDWLQELGYVRTGMPAGYAIEQHNARLFAVLGYDVSVVDDRVSAKRLSCPKR